MKTTGNSFVDRAPLDFISGDRSSDELQILDMKTRHPDSSSSDRQADMPYWSYLGSDEQTEGEEDNVLQQTSTDGISVGGGGIIQDHNYDQRCYGQQHVVDSGTHKVGVDSRHCLLGAATTTFISSRRRHMSGTASQSHQQIDYLSNSLSLFRVKSIKDLHHLSFVMGIHWPVGSPHKGPVMQRAFLCYGVIMCHGEDILWKFWPTQHTKPEQSRFACDI